MINSGRFAKALADPPQNIEIGQGRLHHHNVRAFLDNERHLAQRFLCVCRIHLIRTTIAELRRAFGRVAERSIEDGGKLRRVTHDAGLIEAICIERFADCADATIHHVAGRDHVRASLCVGERRFY